MTRRTVLSFTPEGLAARLARIEQNVDDLKRLGDRSPINLPEPVTKTFSGKAKQSGSVSVPTGTYTLIPFDVEVHDNADMVNIGGAPDRITITVPGYYLLTAEITFQTNTTGYRQVLISKNGGPHPAGTLLTAPAVPPVVSETHVLTATQAELAKGDYLTLGAYHTRGSNLGVGGTYGDTNMTATLLGRFT